MTKKKRGVMNCPNCGMFIGLYACPICSGIVITTSNTTGGSQDDDR